MSTIKSGWKDQIQTFGRSLLLPIALLAPIGMVMGICSAMGQSYMIEKFPFLGNQVLSLIFSSLQTITSIVFNNIPLLFAMGVAQGMAKHEKGIAVFASVVGYLTLNVVMSVYLKQTGTLADAAVAAQVGQGIVLGIQTLKIEALGGLISGLVAAKVADRFHRLELPLAFAFFGGKKSIPIITLVCMVPIGLAMYHTSYLKNRKIAKGVILTCCLTAFLGNITEPLEFSFLFISPPLFILYCVMSGIGSIPYQLLNISIGYIRGTIFDFGIFGLLYENTQWPGLILLGIGNFVVFYFVFRWFIVKYNLETPGREEFEIEESASTLLKEKNWPAIAAIVIESLGGKENMLSVENCISRLRIDLSNPSKVDQIKLRDSGCAGIFFPSDKHIHVVFGPHVEFVRHAIDDAIKK